MKKFIGAVLCFCMVLFFTGCDAGSFSVENMSAATTQNEKMDTTWQPQSETVYITPTGKRYHLDPDCGGKNSYEATMDIALRRGLTPCKKCAC